MLAISDARTGSFKKRSILAKSLKAALSVTVLLAAQSCKSSISPEVNFQAAGATFPAPIYQKWFSTYSSKHLNVRFDYQAIGSGGGIKQALAGTVDFAASDAPLDDEQMASAGSRIIHIPTVIGAIVLTYNLPGENVELNLTPEAIARIFLGQIKKWNDPAISSSNKDVNLPASDIQVVHRSDGSGTTFQFTSFLSQASQDWKNTCGASTSVNWPVGTAAKGNEGIARQVTQTPYSIGYVELIYAIQNKLHYASVSNSAGQYVRPSLDSINAAAASVKMPEDLRLTIINAPGANAYPISSFTYLLIYQDQPDRDKGKALVDFLWWATHDGQQMVRDLTYAPLPSQVVSKVETKIKSITFHGRRIKE